MVEVIARRVESNREPSTKGLLRQQGCHQYFT